MTPAGINPFTGDLNWQRMASYLIGPVGNGIALDSNGSLLNLFTSSSYGATAPIVLTGTQFSLSYTSPLDTSGGSLTMSLAKPLILSGTNLGLATASPLYVNNNSLAISTSGALVMSGTNLTVGVTSPLAVSGGSIGLNIDTTMAVSGGNLGVHYTAPLVVSNTFLTLGYNLPLFLNGSNLDIDLSPYATVANTPQVTDSGELTLTSGAFTWSGTAPTSFQRALYRWIQHGKMVIFSYKVEYSGAGIGNSQVQFALPGGAPTPAGWSAGTLLAYVYGIGNISNSTAGDTNGDGITSLANSSGWKVQTNINSSGTIAAKFAAGTLCYFTA